MIGDWQVKRCEPEGIRLVVNPGYGASKKMSYTQLDVSAVLSYTFALRPTSAPQLFINGLKVSSEHIRSAFELVWNLNFLPCNSATKNPGNWAMYPSLFLLASGRSTRGR